MSQSLAAATNGSGRILSPCLRRVFWEIVETRPAPKGRKISRNRQLALPGYGRRRWPKRLPQSEGCRHTQERWVVHGERLRPSPRKTRARRHAGGLPCETPIRIKKFLEESAGEKWLKAAADQKINHRRGPEKIQRCRNKKISPDASDGDNITYQHSREDIGLPQAQANQDEMPPPRWRKNRE